MIGYVFLVELGKFKNIFRIIKFFFKLGFFFIDVVLLFIWEIGIIFLF